MRKILLIVAALTLGACSTYGGYPQTPQQPANTYSVPSSVVTSYDGKSTMGQDGVFREDSGEVDKSATCEYQKWGSYECKLAWSLDAAQSGQSAQDTIGRGTDNLKRWFQYCRPRGNCWDDAKRRAGDWWRNP